MLGLENALVYFVVKTFWYKNETAKKGYTTLTK